MTRFTDVIRAWFGWCPARHAIKMRAGSGEEAGFAAGSPVINRPRFPGTGESALPGGGMYEHTQRGTIIISAVSAAIVIILASAFISGPEWVALIVLLIMVFVLAIMSSLTVSCGDGLLKIRFGPVGLIRKDWQLSEIASVRPVTNPWYYGYGLRWTSHGRLYNVSGSGAVEILLLSGETFRIGTDEPEALAGAISHAIQ